MSLIDGSLFKTLYDQGDRISSLETYGASGQFTDIGIEEGSLALTEDPGNHSGISSASLSLRYAKIGRSVLVSGVYFVQASTSGTVIAAFTDLPANLKPRANTTARGLTVDQATSVVKQMRVMINTDDTYVIHVIAAESGSTYRVSFDLVYEADQAVLTTGVENWTPTWTNDTNVSASSNERCSWTRERIRGTNEEWICLCGTMRITPTAGSAEAVVSTELPVPAKSLIFPYIVGGAAPNYGAAPIPLAGAVNNSTGRVELRFTPTSTGEHRASFMVRYRADVV